MLLNFQIFGILLDLPLLLISKERLLVPPPLPLTPALESPLSLGSELDHQLHEDRGHAHLFSAVHPVISSVPAPHHVLNKRLSNELTTSWVFSKAFVTVYVTELVMQVQVCLTEWELRHSKHRNFLVQSAVQG